MAPNSWLAYKRDTRYLLKWMIDKSNSILKSLKTPDEDAPPLNTTGAIRISDIVLVSRFISRHLKEIPPVVFRLFEYVIAARTAYYDVFQNLLGEGPDPELEKNNQSHKYVIDAFKQAFDILGGQVWQKSQTRVGDDHGADDLESIFTNKFAAFNIVDDGVEENGDTDEGLETEPKAVNQARNRPQKKKKSKKGARGKKSKTKASKATVEENSSNDIPLESCRVIEAGDKDIMTDYLIGAYALVKEWVDLRVYIQEEWREVAYDGVNSVIAAAQSRLAIGMVERTAALISIDFPGPHDCYKIVMDTVTRGDPEKAQLSTVLSVLLQGTESSDQHVDVKELLLLYTYNDLLEFIRDFQKTRSGKPTKAMQKDLSKWSADADLKCLSKEERIQWRRRFTISWLYDFVNVATYCPIMENKLKGKNHDLSKVDWSINGPWWDSRTLWGLKDFAADIAHWVYQEQSTDNSRKILPHHVFELSCIVDSLTISRGWSLNRRGGHILDPNGPAKHFSATRDIDSFLDRDNKKYSDRGYLMAIECLKGWLSRDIPWNIDKNDWHGPRNEETIALIEDFQIELGRTLGAVGAFIIHATGPNWSRFAKNEDDRSGVWKYSPFLCGAGLMEALEIAYRVSMKLWDETPEVFMAIHLYNMLREEGYLYEEYPSEIYLFSTMQDLFVDAWFVDGKVPTCDFAQALTARWETIMTRVRDPERLRQVRHNQQTALDIQDDLDLRLRWLFYTKSHLVLYREVGWNPERIEDAGIHLPSAMGLLRLGHTKTLTDPLTGRRSLEDTKLVKQARALGASEPALIAVTDFFRDYKASNKKEVENGMASAARKMVPGLPKDSDVGDFVTQLKKRTGGGKYELEGIDLLAIIRQDLEEDLVGVRPLSGVNYMWITLEIMLMWKRMEDKLGKARNRIYVRAYETGHRGLQKRVFFTRLVLQERDHECLRIMTEAFDEFNLAFAASFFWDNDRSLASKMKWGVGG